MCVRVVLNICIRGIKTFKLIWYVYVYAPVYVDYNPVNENISSKTFKLVFSQVKYPLIFTFHQYDVATMCGYFNCNQIKLMSLEIGHKQPVQKWNNGWILNLRPHPNLYNGDFLAFGSGSCHDLRSYAKRILEIVVKVSGRDSWLNFPYI